MIQPVPPTGLLQGLIAGTALTEEQYQQLEEWELSDGQRATALGITPTNVQATLRQRTHLLWQVYPAVERLWSDRLHTPAPLLELLWTLWLPLTLQLVAERKQLDRPLVQGILGGQGTGKTTLCSVLVLLLGHVGYPALSLSLDDLYKTYAERQLLQQQDPRFRWRGPPGTHDVALGVQTLQQLRNPERHQQPIAIPRFDKSAYGGTGDRGAVEVVREVQIVLFEGWFVGVPPLDPAGLAMAPLPDSEGDPVAARAFVQETNRRLAAYRPLWDCLDRLMVLWPQDYRLSQQWRQEAEQQAIAAGKAGMSQTEIAQFVNYFWQALPPDLFVRPLLEDPQRVDLVVEVDPSHLPIAIYQPVETIPGAP